MRKLISLCTSLCTMVLIFASPVRAQSVLWVANNGNDANICSQTAPCATFQGILNKVGSVNNLQINCLTSGNYGAVNITASITIDCGTGNIGNIFSSGSAITINAGAAISVVLRHLSLNGFGSAGTGIVTQAFPGGSLTIEDCTIQKYTGPGISFGPSSGRGLLRVSDSHVIDNGTGIFIFPTAGRIASVQLDRVELSGNTGDGLLLVGSGVAAGTMRNSLAGSNGVNGVEANAGQVFFTVEESSIVANLSNGIRTGSAGSNLNVTASTISANGRGISAGAGSIVSFGNNTLNGNASDGAFTSTVALK